MIGESSKTIDKLQKELNNLKRQKSDENLRNVVNEKMDSFDKFCECPHECKNPRHHHHNHEGLSERIREKHAKMEQRPNHHHERKKGAEVSMETPKLKPLISKGYEPKKRA